MELQEFLEKYFPGFQVNTEKEIINGYDLISLKSDAFNVALQNFADKIWEKYKYEVELMVLHNYGDQFAQAVCESMNEIKQPKIEEL
jgi:hypothetical protein